MDDDRRMITSADRAAMFCKFMAAGGRGVTGEPPESAPLEPPVPLPTLPPMPPPPTPVTYRRSVIATSDRIPPPVPSSGSSRQRLSQRPLPNPPPGVAENRRAAKQSQRAANQCQQVAIEGRRTGAPDQRPPSASAGNHRVVTTDSRRADCQSQQVACQSQRAACQSQQVACQSQRAASQSQQVACQSQRAACQSQRAVNQSQRAITDGRKAVTPDQRPPSVNAPPVTAKIRRTVIEDRGAVVADRRPPPFTTENQRTVIGGQRTATPNQKSSLVSTPTAIAEIRFAGSEGRRAYAPDQRPLHASESRRADVPDQRPPPITAPPFTTKIRRTAVTPDQRPLPTAPAFRCATSESHRANVEGRMIAAPNQRRSSADATARPSVAKHQRAASGRQSATVDDRRTAAAPDQRRSPADVTARPSVTKHQRAASGRQSATSVDDRRTAAPDRRRSLVTTPPPIAEIHWAGIEVPRPDAPDRRPLPAVEGRRRAAVPDREPLPLPPLPSPRVRRRPVFHVDHTITAVRAVFTSPRPAWVPAVPSEPSGPMTTVTLYPHLQPDYVARPALKCPGGGFAAVKLYASHGRSSDAEWCSIDCLPSGPCTYQVRYVVYKHRSLSAFRAWFACQRCATCHKYLARAISPSMFHGLGGFETLPPDGQWQVPRDALQMWDVSFVVRIAHR